MAEAAPLPFDWADPFGLDSQLSDEERLVRDTAAGYAQERLQPRVTEAYLEENFDREIMSEMGELGLLGATIPTEYGGAGLNYVSYGLVAREVERVDSGYRSAMSVQSSLVMHPHPCLRLGGAAHEISAEARHRRMGRLLRPHRAGCWLRSGGMRTRATKVDGGYRLSGSKMWITNSRSPTSSSSGQSPTRMRARSGASSSKRE
jgi:glutaryl-CoA dehydrogenase